MHVGGVPGHEHPSGPIARRGPMVHAEGAGPEGTVDADRTAGGLVGRLSQFGEGDLLGAGLRVSR